jgi:hypothetical protein
MSIGCAENTAVQITTMANPGSSAHIGGYRLTDQGERVLDEWSRNHHVSGYERVQWISNTRQGIDARGDETAVRNAVTPTGVEPRTVRDPEAKMIKQIGERERDND